MAYPTLSRNVSYTIKLEREDSVIRSEFEGGYQNTRQKYTRLRKKWTMKYTWIPPGDMSTLATFIDTTVKGGADAFDWTCPLDNVTYQVRYAAPPVFNSIIKHPSGDVFYNSEEFTLNQV